MVWSVAPAETRAESWVELREFCWSAVTELAWDEVRPLNWVSLKACRKKIENLEYEQNITLCIQGVASRGGLADEAKVEQVFASINT